MIKIRNKVKTIIENIKQHIDEWSEDRDAEMKKWKEEDPEGYYEHLVMYYHEKY